MVSCSVSMYIRFVCAFSFEAVKPLGRVEILPSPYVTESTRIAILLPTFEHQINEAMDFVTHYERICMEHQDNTFLMMVCLLVASLTSIASVTLIVCSLLNRTGTSLPSKFTE